MLKLLNTSTSAAKQPPLVTNQQLENYLCTDLDLCKKAKFMELSSQQQARA